MSWIPALTCLIIPLLIALVARNAWQRYRERELLRAQNPNEPWLWRRDWASRTAGDSGNAFGGFLWLFAIAWNLFSLPVYFVFRQRTGTDPAFALVVIFPILGVVMIAWALYLTLRRRKYRRTICRFNELPIPIGRTLHGEFETQVAEVPQDGFVLRLSCVRRIVTSTGKSTHVRETILWQDEQTVGSGAAMPNPNGVRVPFRFAIPNGLEPTDERNRRDSVIWRLEASADVPGIDFRAVFQLPVFATAASSEGPSAFAPLVETPWSPPAYMTFGMSATGAEQVTIRPQTPMTDWIIYLVFVVLWFGALAMIARLGGPIAVVIVFGLFGAVVLYFALDVLAGRSVIVADRTKLTSRRSLFGRRTIPAEEIVAIDARIGSSTSGRALYDLEARLRNGGSVAIAKHLRNRRDAEMLAARLARSAGVSSASNPAAARS